MNNYLHEIYISSVIPGLCESKVTDTCGQKNVAFHFSKQRLLSAIQPSVNAVHLLGTTKMYPEGNLEREKQDIGPRQLRRIAKE